MLSIVFFLVVKYTFSIFLNTSEAVSVLKTVTLNTNTKYHILRVIEGQQSLKEVQRAQVFVVAIFS
jgi:hypothetical protein